jgi:hypothetical protein
VIQHYFFSNLLIFTINILSLGTFLSYVIYFFSYKNQYQNLIKYDVSYNVIKILLTLTLGLSFFFFILFFYYFYTYYNYVNNYSIFSYYKLIPKVFVNIFFFWLEFSVDFFGIVLLFLAYFVGILSLLALDNRIF